MFNRVLIFLAKYGARGDQYFLKTKKLIMYEVVINVYVTLYHFAMKLIYVKLDQFGLECKTNSFNLQYMQLNTINFEICVSVVYCHFTLFLIIPLV